MAVVVFCSLILSDKNGGADNKSGDDVGYQHGDLTAYLNAGNTHRADILTHNDHVNDAVKRLKQI